MNKPTKEQLDAHYIKVIRKVADDIWKRSTKPTQPPATKEGGG